jgi:hypothetical protein
MIPESTLLELPATEDVSITLNVPVSAPGRVAEPDRLETSVPLNVPESTRVNTTKIPTDSVTLNVPASFLFEDSADDEVSVADRAPVSELFDAPDSDDVSVTLKVPASDAETGVSDEPAATLMAKVTRS